MNNQAVNNETIVKYLLGSLPEAETERFDELSITSDEFAETLKAAEKDLVDAYVQGELTGAKLERFKFHYLASPLRREKVDFAQAFQVLAEKDAPAPAREVSADYPAKSAAKPKASGWFSGLGVFTIPRLAWQWGFAAAALAFLFAGGWLALDNVRLREQMSQTQARRVALGQREQELQTELEGQRVTNSKTEQELADVREERARLEGELRKEQEQRAAKQGPAPAGVSIASFILAPQMRGAGQIQTLSIPSNTDSVAMRLELEPNKYPAYRVELLDQSNNQTLWRSRQLKARVAGDGKTLGIRFPASLLKPRVYMLRVSGVSANGASVNISDYPFKVVK